LNLKTSLIIQFQNGCFEQPSESLFYKIENYASVTTW